MITDHASPYTNQVFQSFPLMGLQQYLNLFGQGGGMILETLSLGMSSLLAPEVFAPKRRERLPEIALEVPLPVVVIGNMNTSLLALSHDAWLAFHKVEQQALQMKAQQKNLG